MFHHTYLLATNALKFLCCCCFHYFWKICSYFSPSVWFLPLLPWSPSFLANSRNVIGLGINLQEGGLDEYVCVYCSILYLLLWTQFGKVTVYQKMQIEMFALEISHCRSPFLEGNITRIWSGLHTRTWHWKPGGWWIETFLWNKPNNFSQSRGLFTLTIKFNQMKQCLAKLWLNLKSKIESHTWK